MIKKLFNKENIIYFLVALGTITAVNRIPQLTSILKPRA